MEETNENKQEAPLEINLQELEQEDKELKEKFIKEYRPPIDKKKKETKKNNTSKRLITKVTLENGAIIVSDGRKKEWIDVLPDELNEKKTKEIYDKLKKLKFTDSNNCNQVIQAILKYIDEKPLEEQTQFDSQTQEDILLNSSKKQIELPRLNRSMSVFAEEIAEELKDKNLLFFRPDLKEIIEIGRIETETEKGKKHITGFLPMRPNRFITTTEKHINFIKMSKNKTTKKITPKIKSISSEIASVVLASENLEKRLPQITRIFTIPMPIMYKGELTFPQNGYDPRFCSWLPYDAPKITDPEMKLEDAKELIKTIFSGFCFETTADYTKALAGFITPYLRGLYARSTERTPVFVYMANLSGAGKDYCSGVTAYTYEGVRIEETPISTGEKFGGGGTEELEKKVLANFMKGRKRYHSSNNKGHLDNAVLEELCTAPIFTARLLGVNKTPEFDNDLEISLSANTGLTYEKDMRRRIRVVNLNLKVENANKRVYAIPDLHGYVLENREKILSALYCLVRNWIKEGRKEGSLDFNSYPEWGKICGGIMESAGYPNPCEDDEIVSYDGDSETKDIKDLIHLGYEAYKQRSEKALTKDDIVSIVTENYLFENLDLKNNVRADVTKFGILLKKYNGVKFTYYPENKNEEEYFIIMTMDKPNDRFGRNNFSFTQKEIEPTLIDYMGKTVEDNQNKEEVSQGVVLNE